MNRPKQSAAAISPAAQNGWANSATPRLATACPGCLAANQRRFYFSSGADQIPSPLIIEHCIESYFATIKSQSYKPHSISTTPPRAIPGSDAPLFYGPIQGKDGWNATFLLRFKRFSATGSIIAAWSNRLVLRITENNHEGLKKLDKDIQQTNRPGNRR